MFTDTKVTNTVSIRNRGIVLNVSDVFHYVITSIVVLIQSRYIQIYPFHTTLNSAYTMISRMIALLVFTWCLIAYFANRKHIKIEPSIIIILLYYVFLLFSTFLMNTGNYRRVGMQAYPILSLVLFSEYQIKRRPKVFLLSTALTLTVLNLCNFYFMFSSPDKYGVNSFFLGNKNGLLTGMLIWYASLFAYINLYTSITKIRKNIIRTGCFIIISLALIRAWSATDLVAWIIVILMHFLPRMVVRINWIKYYVIGWFLLVIIRIQSLFQKVIVNILHKNLTLTNRTIIWDEALVAIKNNLVFGHGVGDSNNFFYVQQAYVPGLYSAHNELLQILYEGGLVCAIIFVLVPHLAIKRMKDTRMLECIIAIVGCLITCLCEATGTDAIFFLSILGIALSKYVIQD